MTLAATKQYAFGASILVGLAATMVAVTLISVLLGNPERVVLAMGDADFSAFVQLILDRLLATARALQSLL